ncbi:MAG: glycoside hydrolase family 127 protein [Verrucomicrobia bacterium]|nr:glycoside hydrolase family 127 protein [Verrucomicrobiota bacterium]
MTTLKLTRRDLLKTAGVSAAAIAFGGLPNVGSRVCLAAESRKLKGNGIRSAFYQATVPDTLDLAHRAKWAENALTEMLDPSANWEIYFGGHLGSHESTGLPTNNPKYAESLPMMRVITGDDYNRNVEQGMTEALVSLIQNDGLYYAPYTPKRPWHGANEDFANVYGQARCLLAMMARYQVDKDRQKEWDQRIRKMVDRLAEIAIYKDDYAYFPKSGSDGIGLGEDFSYLKKSGWRNTEEPPADMWMAIYTGGEIRALSRWYIMSGDKKALDLAGKLTKFIMHRPSFWTAEAGPSLIVQSDHGWWKSHFHGYTLTLRGLLEYATATSNIRLKEFVRDGYEFSRLYGIAKVGYFPEFSNVKKNEACEPCCIANMIALAIKLSDLGLGDYWDHVDQIVRNHFIEAQTWSDQCNKMSPSKYPRDSAKKQEWMTLGGWGAGCCTGNSSQALYYAWSSIVRYRDGVAQANLLLNRASEWLDVNSYLPYEGKVEIQNKKADRIQVRIPAWVDRKMVKCSVQGKPVSAEWAGNYLIFSKVGRDQRITVEFPMSESVETLKYTNAEYTCRFRGNTLISATKKGEGAWNPPDRSSYMGDKAPLKMVTRYVAPVLIEW